jgi:hypothetical protein
VVVVLELALAEASGDEVVVVVVVSVDVAGVGFTIVVLVSLVAGEGEAAGATVSVFCSQAPRSAALARMQNNFFIVIDWIAQDGSKPESKQGVVSVLLKFILGNAFDSG